MTDLSFMIGPSCTMTFQPIDKKPIHSGDNLVIKMILNHYDSDVKKIKVDQYKGIENTVYIRIFGHEKCYAKPIEGPRHIEETDSNSVFLINFILKQGQIIDFKDAKNKIALGIAHDLYPYELSLKEEFREELVKNFT